MSLIPDIKKVKTSIIVAIKICNIQTKLIHSELAPEFAGYQSRHDVYHIDQFS